MNGSKAMKAEWIDIQGLNRVSHAACYNFSITLEEHYVHTWFALDSNVLTTAIINHQMLKQTSLCWASLLQILSGINLQFTSTVKISVWKSKRNRKTCLIDRLKSHNLQSFMKTTVHIPKRKKYSIRSVFCFILFLPMVHIEKSFDSSLNI